MKTPFLTAVSALAILVTAPAMAADLGLKTQTDMSVERTKNQNDIESVTESELKQGWSNTKDAVSGAADSVSEATGNLVDDIKATFIDEDGIANADKVIIKPRQTASYLINQPLLNSKGEKIATVEDVILDANGKAMLVVVNDGGVFGLGSKNAAFNYDVLAYQNAEGDVIAPLTEDQIEAAASFSYEAEDGGENVRVIPANGYSVASLMNADVLNNKGETVATIEDITLEGGQAKRLLIGFDKTLGLGGEKAVLNFNSLNMVRDGDDLNFKMSAKQSVEFDAYKKAVMN